MADAYSIMKRVVESAGNVNYGTRLALELLDPQSKSQFEMILYPQGKGFSWTSLLDTTVMKLYIQTMQIQFPSFEYARGMGEQYIKAIKYPEEVTFTFLETELGIVRNYMNGWLGDIVKYDYITGEDVFKENQESAKKNAIILLNMGNQLPSPASIKLEGLKYKSQGEVTLGHDQADPMMIECVFSVDHVHWQTPFGY